MPSIRGKIVLMGSGELTATMVEVHKSLLAGFPDPPQAAFIDTPAGFQLNADQISQKAAEYFRHHIQHPLTIASFKSREHTTDFDAEKAFHTLRESDYILIGPGSPTYAVRQWNASPIPEILTQCVKNGGTLVAASAAALTVGRFTLPVYEIYKVGQDLQWASGMNVLEHFGFNLVVVPHWNNAEGGTHDTRRCFMGEPRFRKLEAMLPEDVFILGLDEHTACIIDFATNQVEIKGLGRVILRRQEDEAVFNTGDCFSRDILLGTGLESALKAEIRPAKLQPSIPNGENDSFWEKIHSLEADFNDGLARDDSKKATNALLEFDRTIWQAQTNLENEEFVAQARDTLRDLIVLFGTKLDASPRNEAECLSPLVEALLQLRSKFRLNRQWAEADALRDALQQANILVEDDRENSNWRLERPSDNDPLKMK